MRGLCVSPGIVVLVVTGVVWAVNGQTSGWSPYGWSANGDGPVAFAQTQPGKGGQTQPNNGSGQDVERAGRVTDRAVDGAGEATEKGLNAADKAVRKGLEKAGEAMERAGEWMREHNQ